jgi:hypothetical protein
MANEEFVKVDEIKKVIDCSEVEAGDKFVLINFKDTQMIGIDASFYKKLQDKFNKLLEMEFNLNLEREIIPEFPIDLEDVKAVVKEEMKINPDEKVSNIVKRIKKEHPNLFMDLDKIFEE